MSRQIDHQILVPVVGQFPFTKTRSVWNSQDATAGSAWDFLNYTQECKPFQDLHVQWLLGGWGEAGGLYKGFFGPKGSSVHLWIILVPSGRSVSKFKLENYIPATRKHQSETSLHILLWRPALLEVSLSSPWARCPSGGSWPEPRGAGGILCPGGRHLTCSENLVPGLQLLTAELCTVVF